MKRNDFIKSLQDIKKQLTLHKKKNNAFVLHTHNTSTQTVCICQDSSGVQKYLYSSKEELEYLLASKHITLRAYPCPYEKGWHLTKG